MVLDIIIILLIAFGFYSGYSKGIIETLFAVVSVIISIAAALKLSPIVAKILVGTFGMQGNVALIIALIATFFLFLVFIRFVGGRIEALLKTLNINFINKLAGGLLMAILYTIMTSMIMGLVRDFKLTSPEFFEDSNLFAIVEPLSNQSVEFIKSVAPDLKEYWITMMDNMDELKENSKPLLKE